MHSLSSLTLFLLLSFSAVALSECDIESVRMEAPVQYLQLSPDGQFAIIALEEFQFACVNVDNAEVQWQSTFSGYDYQYGFVFHENALIIGRERELLYVDLATGEEFASIHLDHWHLEDAFLDLEPISIESAIVGFPRVNNHLLMRFSDSNVLINLSDRVIQETWYTDINEYAIVHDMKWTYLLTVEEQVRLDAFSNETDERATFYFPSQIEDCLEVFWVRAHDGQFVASTSHGVFVSQGNDRTLKQGEAELASLLAGMDSKPPLVSTLFAQQYRDMSFGELEFHMQLRQEPYSAPSISYVHMTDSTVARTSLFGTDHAGDTVCTEFTIAPGTRSLTLFSLSKKVQDTILHSVSIEFPPLFNRLVGYQQLFVSDSTTAVATQVGLFLLRGAFEEGNKSIQEVVSGRLSFVDDRSQGYAWVTGDSLVLFHEQQPLAVLSTDSLSIGQVSGSLPEELRGFVPTSWMVTPSCGVFATHERVVLVVIDEGSFVTTTRDLEQPMGFDYTRISRSNGHIKYSNSSSAGIINEASPNLDCVAGEEFDESNELEVLINNVGKRSCMYMRDADVVLLVP